MKKALYKRQILPGQVTQKVRLNLEEKDSKCKNTKKLKVKGWKRHNINKLYDLYLDLDLKRQ